jgi:RND family efflux transporter MFP subunit
MTSLPTTETVTPGRDQRLPQTPAPTEAERVSAQRRGGRRVLAIGALAVVILGGALVAGTLPRLKQEQAVNTAAAAVSVGPPRVTVAVAQTRAQNAERVLPGNALPLMEAALFARTTGYLNKRLVDIGDHVTEGQLLAEISAPDVDDQLAQAQANLTLAKANLALAQANAELARITLERDLKAGSIAVAPLQLDQDRATVKTTDALVKSSLASIQVNEAAVQRYTDLQSFQKITAPFTGVITARNVEKGDLITADSASTTKELFHVMQTDTLRVFVNVPQVFATGIKVGQDAVIFRRDEPQKLYPGKVVRTTKALDPNARTLLTEVDVPNPNDALLPGMYLQVKFVLERDAMPVLIPTAALATRTGGPRLAVLDNQNRVHYRTVQLGHDYGLEIEVIAGLKAGETVVVHPGDDLPEGTVVEPVPLPK